MMRARMRPPSAPRTTLLALLSLALPGQAPGDRITLTPEARLYVPPLPPASDAPLDFVIHMHGDHALAQDAYFSTWKQAALISVHINGLSSVYTNYFASPTALQNLLDRAAAALPARVAGSATPSSRLALTAFSAGYAGVRQILAQPAHRARVRSVVLGDGLHTGYVNGNQVDPAQMIDFVAFARSAAAGATDFRFSHSSIVPGTYASTTECANYLIAQLAASRAPWSGTNALGMTSTSRCQVARFAVHGFAGNQAADHTKHFQYLWWMLLDAEIGGHYQSLFPLVDRFTARGKDLGAWQHKFVTHTVAAVSPPAPGGDGFALVVKDPAGGYDSARIGPRALADSAVDATILCDHRPQLATYGFERVGVFLRDNGNGGFEGTSGGGGYCYALFWDSTDGRTRGVKVVNGVLTDLVPPRLLTGTAWRRLRIEAQGPALTFYVDGVPLGSAVDSTYASGQSGVGHHEYFSDNSLARGARVDQIRLDLLGATDVR